MKEKRDFSADKRLIWLSSISAVIGIVCAFVALGLLWLISFLTRPDSTGKRNTLLKDFKRGHEAETFSKTIVKESLNPLDVRRVDFSKVSLLW